MQERDNADLDTWKGSPLRKIMRVFNRDQQLVEGKRSKVKLSRNDEQQGWCWVLAHLTLQIRLPRSRDMIGTGRNTPAGTDTSRVQTSEKDSCDTWQLDNGYYVAGSLTMLHPDGQAPPEYARLPDVFSNPQNGKIPLRANGHPNFGEDKGKLVSTTNRC